jgi:UDP-N-acetylglucosamine 2-epimerase
MFYAKTLIHLGYKTFFITCDGSPNSCNIGFQTLSPNSDMPCNSCIRNRNNLIPKNLQLNFSKYTENEFNDKEIENFNYLHGLQNIFANSNPSGKNKEIIEKRMSKGAVDWFNNMQNLITNNGEPKTIYLFNGRTYPENIISFWAEQNDINVRYFENGSKKNSIFFSSEFAALNVFNFKNSNPSLNQLEKINQLMLTKINSEVDPFSFVRWNKKKRLKINDEYKKCFSIFLNLPYDTSQINTHTVFTNIYEWIDEIIKYTKYYPKYFFVFNIHTAEYDPKRPSRENLFKYIKNKTKNINNVSIRKPFNNISSYEILKLSDGVLTYNSTIGLEARILKIPVLEAAETHYSRNKVIKIVNNKKDWDEEFKILMDGNLKTLNQNCLNKLKAYYSEFLLENNFQLDTDEIIDMNYYLNLFKKEIKNIS